MIGSGRPFCIIGERINPTGRKAFQAQLQAGDLSQIEIDVAEQVAGGADMLDVNVGDPLADAARRVPGVRGLHLISFRKEAGIARLCARLGIPTRAERELSGDRPPVVV